MTKKEQLERNFNICDMLIILKIADIFCIIPQSRRRYSLYKIKPITLLVTNLWFFSVEYSRDVILLRVN